MPWQPKSLSSLLVKIKVDTIYVFNLLLSETIFSSIQDLFSYLFIYFVSYSRFISNYRNREETIGMVEMKGILLGLIFGFTIGWIVGVGAAFVLYSVFFCIKTQIERSNSPIPSRGVDSTTAFSDSNVGQETPRTSEWSSLPQWLEGLKRNNVVSACGIPKCSYKYGYWSSA